MKTVPKLTAVACIFVFASAAYANNTYFLPGDAFFFTRLDLNGVKQIQDVESPTFIYGNHWNGGFGCGFLGYRELRLMKTPAETRRALLDSYLALQAEIKKDPNLGGAMSVFIYSKNYDWQKYGLGLQYNENWADETAAFGAHRDHFRLESFVESPSLIMQNWRDSSRVPSLGAECPNLTPGHRGEWLKTPVQIPCKQCQILIIPNREFKKFFYPRNGLEVIRIVDGKQMTLVKTNDGWTQK